PKLSASARDKSSLALATLSPGTVRNCSPAASSVPSISVSAVDSQADSGRSDRFLNPSTAIEGRAFIRAAARSPGALPSYVGQPKPAAKDTQAAAAATAALCRATHLLSR